MDRSITFIDRGALRQMQLASYLYFFLIIFEGALRKWVIPSLASPLLVIRDPVALFLLYRAIEHKIIRSSPFWTFLLFVSGVAFFTSVLIGHGNLYVALFGLRIMLLHFPLIFVFREVMLPGQIQKIAHWMIILSIPMALLIIFQFYSPQSAWVNRGVGGTEGAGFSGAMGYLRPPGSFSFTNGVSLFFPLVGVFLFWALLKNIKLPGALLLLSAIAVLLSIPFSISRGLFFQLIVTVLFFVIIIVKKPTLSIRFLSFGAVIAGLAVLIAGVSFVSTGVKVFQTRFTTANQQEGGLDNILAGRLLGGLIRAIKNSSDLPFFGYGLGLGTNVGSALMTGSRSFLISEGEWGRILGEMGLLLGLTLLMTRLVLCIRFLRNSYQAIGQFNFLPWLLSSCLVLNVIQGQWSQPTTLGFAVFFTGILLASLRHGSK